MSVLKNLAGKFQSTVDVPLVDVPPPSPVDLAIGFDFDSQAAVVPPGIAPPLPAVTPPTPAAPHPQDRGGAGEIAIGPCLRCRNPLFWHDVYDNPPRCTTCEPPPIQALCSRLTYFARMPSGEVLAVPARKGPKGGLKGFTVDWEAFERRRVRELSAGSPETNGDRPRQTGSFWFAGRKGENGKWTPSGFQTRELVDMHVDADYAREFDSDPDGYGYDPFERL